MKELVARRERAQADLKDLETSDKGQVSKTDPDARLLSKGDQTIAGYNVQSVVDDKHMLIVASEVVNRSDAGHLHMMAKAVKDVLDVEALQVLADEGYYNSEDLKACEDDGITAYVPIHEGNRKLEKQGRFPRKDFSYDAATDVYRCPAGQLLHPTKKPWTNASGRVEVRYLSSKTSCDGCPIRARCLAPKAKYRSIFRWEHEDVLDRHRERMASEGASRTDVSPLRHRRASLRNAQMPRRLSALPRPRLRQGTRRMEPDGALLQLHPRAQHSRLRPLRRLPRREATASVFTLSQMLPRCTFCVDFSFDPDADLPN